MSEGVATMKELNDVKIVTDLPLDDSQEYLYIGKTPRQILESMLNSGTNGPVIGIVNENPPFLQALSNMNSYGKAICDTICNVSTPYMFIPSFGDIPSVPKSAPISLEKMLLINDNKTMSAPVIRVKKDSSHKTAFQGPIPAVRNLTDSDGNKWHMRCFCNKKHETDRMILCERCDNWLHAECVNVNENTEPEHYVCPICMGMHIKCSCEDNLNYRVPLIRCTKCGYYRHRSCVEIGPGPVPVKSYICPSCNGPRPTYQNVYITSFPTAQMITMFTMTNTPFASLITDQNIDSNLFLSSVYNNYRSFFYLVHPLYVYKLQKKKRMEVSTTFFKALYHFAFKLYGLFTDEVTARLDELARKDLYGNIQPSEPTEKSKISPYTVSDLAKPELMKTKIQNDLKDVTLPQLEFSPNGARATTNLLPHHLVAVASGLVGLVSEFPCEEKSDPRFYSIGNGKMLLDTTHMSSNPLSGFRRSFTPNCVIQTFRYNERDHVGVFAGVSDANGINMKQRREKFPISAGSELLLPFDFPPGLLEDPEEWLSWKFDIPEEGQPQPEEKQEVVTPSPLKAVNDKPASASSKVPVKTAQRQIMKHSTSLPQKPKKKGIVKTKEKPDGEIVNLFSNVKIEQYQLVLENSDEDYESDYQISRTQSYEHIGERRSDPYELSSLEDTSFIEGEVRATIISTSVPEDPRDRLTELFGF